MSRSVKAHLLLLGVVFVWGSTFVLVKDALADVSPLLFNLMRMALAALCLGILYRRHIGHVDRRRITLWSRRRLVSRYRVSIPDGGAAPHHAV